MLICQSLLLIKYSISYRVKKKLEFQLALGASLPQILLDQGKSLMIWLVDDLPDSLPTRQVRMKLLVQKKNLIVPDDRTALFSSPALARKIRQISSPEN